MLSLANLQVADPPQASECADPVCAYKYEILPCHGVMQLAA
ncbi:MAG: hypothetical protein R6V06_10280 [Kiritimatiellia bacterium]